MHLHWNLWGITRMESWCFMHGSPVALWLLLTLQNGDLMVMNPRWKNWWSTHHMLWMICFLWKKYQMVMMSRTRSVWLWLSKDHYLVNHFVAGVSWIWDLLQAVPSPSHCRIGSRSLWIEPLLFGHKKKLNGTERSKFVLRPRAPMS